MTCVLLSRSIGGVPVDVVVTENHTAEMEIAEHPVERGAKVSDHAWRKPYKVELGSVIGGVGAFSGASPMSAYGDLLRVQADAEPFDLVTGLNVYSNMLIKELRAVRDKEHADILSFTASLQEVIIVSTQGGAANAGSGSAGSNTLSGSASSSDAAQGTTDRGQVQAREVTTGGPGLSASADVFEGD